MKMNHASFCLLYEMSLGKNMTSNLPPSLIVRDPIRGHSLPPTSQCLQLLLTSWSVTSPNILSRHIHNDTGI